MIAGSRRSILVAAAVALAALLALDRLALGPALRAWKAQSLHIADLRERVAQGRLAADRLGSLRARWTEAVDRSLPADPAAGEERVLKAVGDWARESRVALVALTPRWRKEADGFQTLECRLTAQGDWLGLARMLDLVEGARIPLRLEQYDLTPRDDRGGRMTLTARFSALRIADADRKERP